MGQIVPGMPQGPGVYSAKFTTRMSLDGKIKAQEMVCSYTSSEGKLMRLSQYDSLPEGTYSNLDIALT